MLLATNNDNHASRENATTLCTKTIKLPLSEYYYSVHTSVSIEKRVTTHILINDYF